MENNSQSNPQVSTPSTHSEGKVLMIAVLMFIFGGVMGNMIPGMPGSQQKGSSLDANIAQESLDFADENNRGDTVEVLRFKMEDLEKFGVEINREIKIDERIMTKSEISELVLSQTGNINRYRYDCNGGGYFFSEIDLNPPLGNVTINTGTGWRGCSATEVQ